MTKKHFEQFAFMLNGQKPIESTDPYQKGAFDQWKVMVRRTADIFGENNSRFNRSKFLEACGYPSD